MSALEDEGYTGGKNPWAIACVVTIATFMEMLDTSIANVALPHMAGGLSANQEQSTWVLTSYLVANAIVLPISGWISSKLGRKRYYMGSVALFTLASLLCGLAPSLGWLVFFRVLQGLAGGGLGPSEQAILTDTFPAKKRGMAAAVYGMSVIFAPAVGPTLGGFITDHYSWRWIFLINVPIGVASLLLANHYVSDPPHLQKRETKVLSVDYVGLALISLGLGCFEVVLDKGQEEDWFHSAFISWFVIISAVSLVGFVIWEWRHDNPIVDIKMFKNRSFAASNLMMLFFGLSLYGTTVLLPQYVQGVMHYTAQQAGAVLSPGGLTIIVLMPMVGLLVSKMDARWLVAFGFLVVSISLFYMAGHLYPGIDLGTAIELRCYQALGIAFLFVPISTIAYDSMPKSHSAGVAGIVNLSRNIGGDIGISLVRTLIARRTQVHHANLAEHVQMGDPDVQRQLHALASTLEQAGVPTMEAMKKAAAMMYRALFSEAVTLSYLDTLRIIGVGTACMLPLVVLLKRATPGQATLGH